MTNPDERRFMEKMQKAGYTVYHSGFPDFILEHRERDELLFVELKTGMEDKLRANQRSVMETLSRHGLNCNVAFVDDASIIPYKHVESIIEYQGRPIWSQEPRPHKVSSAISKVFWSLHEDELIYISSINKSVRGLPEHMKVLVYDGVLERFALEGISIYYDEAGYLF